MQPARRRSINQPRWDFIMFQNSSLIDAYNESYGVLNSVSWRGWDFLAKEVARRRLSRLSPRPLCLAVFHRLNDSLEPIQLGLKIPALPINILILWYKRKPCTLVIANSAQWNVAIATRMSMHAEECSATVPASYEVTSIKLIDCLKAFSWPMWDLSECLLENWWMRNLTSNKYQVEC